MFGSEIIEVAIGLVLVYLLCSLVCSGIREWFSRLMDIRARDLQERIAEMLDDPKVQEKLYEHPLVQSITRRTGLDKILSRFPLLKRLKIVKGRGKPANIPTKIFTAALADMLNSKEVKNLPALKTIIAAAKAEVAGIKDEAKKVRQKIEEWFDASMEQMSAWYKQKTRVIIFWIALPLCIGLNIDSIMIAKYLHYNEASRATVVAAAEKQIEKDTASDAAVKKQDPVKEVKKLQVDFQELGLPLGWNLKADQQKDIRGVPKDWGWLYKVLGILISVFAVSMGAPFWVDIIRKLMGLRKGKIPEKEEEKQPAK